MSDNRRHRSADAERLAEVQARIGHRFWDVGLLRTALTHASFRNEHSGIEGDNQRLEFLGDSVLDLAVSRMAFDLAPHAAEGMLTRIRARVVNTGSLATRARELDLGESLRLGVGEERSGGRERASLLADALEAVLAAVYLDAGYDVAAGVIGRLFGAQVAEVAAAPLDNAKVELQEWAQAAHRLTPTYKARDVAGPQHQRLFEAVVRVGEILDAHGTGSSKKRAEQAAAKAALDVLVQQDEGMQ